MEREHSVRTDEHSVRTDEHSVRTDEHSVRIDKHAQLLREQETILRTFEQNFEQFRAHEEKVHACLNDAQSLYSLLCERERQMSQAEITLEKRIEDFLERESALNNRTAALIFREHECQKIERRIKLINEAKNSLNLRV